MYSTISIIPSNTINTISCGWVNPLRKIAANPVIAAKPVIEVKPVIAAKPVIEMIMIDPIEPESNIYKASVKLNFGEIECIKCSEIFSLTDEDMEFYHGKTMPKKCTPCREARNNFNCIERNCTNTFYLSETELRFFKGPNLTPPKRCESCRAQRKEQRETEAYEQQEEEDNSVTSATALVNAGGGSSAYVEVTCSCNKVFSVKIALKEKLEQEGKKVNCTKCRTTTTLNCKQCKHAFFTLANAAEFEVKGWKPPNCCSKKCKQELEKNRR